MKRLTVWILVLALAMTAVWAVAEETPADSVTGATRQQSQEGAAQAPDMGRGPAGSGQFGDRQQGGRRQMGKPNGTQPAGQQPNATQPDGQQPGFIQGGMQPGNMPSGTRPEGAPSGNGRSHDRGFKKGNAGKRSQSSIDFEAMVTQGVISGETQARISAYLQENQKTLDKSSDAASVLEALLKAEVITQQEYDALNAALTKTT